MTYLIKTRFEITNCIICPCFDTEWRSCNLTGTPTDEIRACEEKLPNCPLEEVLPISANEIKEDSMLTGVTKNEHLRSLLF